MFLFTYVVIGFSSNMYKIPNGQVNGQATGHAPWCENIPSCTAFRWKFKAANYAWTKELCEDDADGDGQSNGLELGDPCCVWKEGSTPDFVTDISIPGDPNSLTSRSMPSCSVCVNVCLSYSSDGQCDDGGTGAEYSVCAYGSDCHDCGPRSPLPHISPLSPPPPKSPLQSPPPHPPPPQHPFSPSLPPPLLPSEAYDVVIVGCGLAGATSVASISHFSSNLSICIICPSLYGSTSVASGNGWLLVPDVDTKSLLLNELERYADAEHLDFDRLKSQQFISDSKSAVEWLKEWNAQTSSSLRLDPVPAHKDIDVSCANVQLCCVDNARHIVSYGDFDCLESQNWYIESKCCETIENTLTQPPSWPTYVHLKNQLKDKVVWFSDNTTTNLMIATVIQNFIQHSNAIVIEDLVTGIEKHDGKWRLECKTGRLIDSDTIVFGNGGFGATATNRELQELGVSDTKYVHARNSRILKSLTERMGWAQEPLNAWFLEFADDQPKWFLWDPKSTVLSEDNRIIYDESASYDERGRIRRKQNITIATLIYEDLVSTEQITNEQYRNIINSDKEKTCNTRSKRLWRNFLANAYGIGSTVNETECSFRVDDTAFIRSVPLYQGIIDTISGPKTNEFHQVLDDSSVYIVGNAGAPSLLEAYVGPGSTLGNAFVSGFAVGKHLMDRI